MEVNGGKTEVLRASPRGMSDGSRGGGGEKPGTKEDTLWRTKTQ